MTPALKTPLNNFILLLTFFTKAHCAQTERRFHDRIQTPFDPARRRGLYRRDDRHACRVAMHAPLRDPLHQGRRTDQIPQGKLGRMAEQPPERNVRRFMRLFFSKRETTKEASAGNAAGVHNVPTKLSCTARHKSDDLNGFIKIRIGLSLKKEASQTRQQNR